MLTFAYVKLLKIFLNAGGNGIVVMSSFIVLGTWNIKQNLNPLVSIVFRSSILWKCWSILVDCTVSRIRRGCVSSLDWSCWIRIMGRQIHYSGSRPYIWCTDSWIYRYIENMDHGSSQFIIVGRTEELERCIIMNKKLIYGLIFFLTVLLKEIQRKLKVTPTVIPTFFKIVRYFYQCCLDFPR